MNKKAYIRVLEAGIAIMLLLGFIYFVTMPTYVQKTPIEYEIYRTINSILDEIERNETYREFVLEEETDETDKIQSFVTTKLSEKQLGGIVVICNMEDICLQYELPDKDIFVRERVIASLKMGIEQPNKNKLILINKKISIYAWTKY